MDNFTGVYVVAFTGRVGDGVVTATGVKAGDIILKAWGTWDNQVWDISTGFAVIVENDDELYQHGLSDSSAYDPHALLIRGVNIP